MQIATVGDSDERGGRIPEELDRIMPALGLGLRYLKKFGLGRFLSAALNTLASEVSSDMHRTIRLQDYDFTSSDLAANRRLCEDWNRTKDRSVKSINWLLPNYYNVAGGVYTFFRLADALSNKGILNRIIVQDGIFHASVKSVRRDLERAVPGSQVDVLYGTKSMPHADISIATFWTTAYDLLHFYDTRGKYYFIGDFEPLFCPAGSFYGLAEATYRFGFTGITSGPILHRIYEEEYGGRAMHINLPVDRCIYYPSQGGPRERVKRIFFYARPPIPRNAFDLGILGLKRIKANYPDVEVVTAGWNVPRWKFPFAVRNYGFLPIQRVAELYRTCDIGLSFMFTRHPSYIPLELMASGCLPISNINNANVWLLKHGYNCLLTEPTPSCVLETFETALNDYSLRKRICNNALETARSVTWEDEQEKLYRFIVGKS